MMASRKQVAEALGVSRQAVEKLIKRGTIKEGPAGIDLDAAIRSYQTNTDPGRRKIRREVQSPNDPLPSRPGRPMHGTGSLPEYADLLTFDGARTAKERANAQLAELKYAEQIKRLIPRETVQAREFAVARKLRDRILGFPQKLQQFVAPDVMKLLTDECEQLVRELQEDAARIDE